MTLFWESIIFLMYIVICCGLIIRIPLNKRSLLPFGVVVVIITLIQAGMFYWRQDNMLLFTMLPLTVYLPTSISMYLLCDNRLTRLSSVWTIGFLAVLLLKVLKKLTISFCMKNQSFSAVEANILVSVVLLFGAIFLIFIVYHFFRNPFLLYHDKNHINGLFISFPILMCSLLLFYFISTTINVQILFLLFLTILSVFMVVLKVLTSSANLIYMKEAEEAVKLQRQLERREYEAVCKRIEAGRIYRHDMRHHLLILEGLVKQGNTDGILSYIENMNGQLSDTEQVIYCENKAANAVLSGYIGQAKEMDCSVTTKVWLPEELPYDEMDLCMLLANALENAINACRAIKEEKERFLSIMVKFSGNQKLVVSIKNTCDASITFGKDGLPVSAGTEEHGIGLKSIQKTVAKYNGSIRCTSSEGEFALHVVLSSAQSTKTIEEKKYKNFRSRKKFSLSFVMGIVLSLTICLPIMVWTFIKFNKEEMIQQVAQIWSMDVGWGDTSFHMEMPTLTEPSTKLSSKLQEYIEQMQNKFLWYVYRKYDGYVNTDITYEILRDDEQWLCIRFDATINAGGSGQYSRCFTFDKENDNVVELCDLFLDESDYISVISEEIIKQMTSQVQNGEGDYFIPGGIWAEECFQAIAPDQNFYINAQGLLVIVFDEYEVAPGSMGMPEFIIGSEVLDAIWNKTY